MQARPLATRLKSEFPIGSVTEPTQKQPGKIVISDSVYVQVPWEDTFPTVAAKNADGSLNFLPQKNSYDALVNDILGALRNASTARVNTRNTQLR